jgi:hypothetical protein
MTSRHLRCARKTVAFGIILGIALAAGSGCSIALNHDELASPARTYSDPIAVSTRAEGINGRVGWGRITLFYIPCVPIHIQGDGNEKVMEQVRDALQQAGYRVNVVETTQAPAREPVLKCKVDTFWFNNYTWLVPFVPTWGDIDLTLSLERQGGQVAWQQSFHGHGFSANFFDGYSSAANKAMMEVLNQMVDAFASDEFHNALVHAAAT